MSDTNPYEYDSAAWWNWKPSSQSTTKKPSSQSTTKNPPDYDSAAWWKGDGD